MYLEQSPVSDFPVAHGATDVVGGIAGPRTWRTLQKRAHSKTSIVKMQISEK